MFGQGRSVSLMKAASGYQEPFVKETTDNNARGVVQGYVSSSAGLVPPLRKGLRPMHTSTLLLTDNYSWQDRTTQDKEYNDLHSYNGDHRSKAFSYPDTLKTLGFDEYHRFNPHYGEQFCKEKPLKTATELRIERLAVGAKQMDSVGVKDVMRQERPIYSTSYGRTHAYLGLLKTIEPIPKPQEERKYGYKREPIHDPISGDLLREDIVPSRGFKKSSVQKLMDIEDNKFKNIRSIVSDGIY